MIAVYCAWCHKEAGRYDASYVPRSVVCQHCKVGQVRVPEEKIGRTYRRNYPEGHFVEGMFFE